MFSDSAATDWVIRTQALSKSYRLYQRPHHRLLQFIAGERRRYYREFVALNSVSLELGRGQTLGVIGANGAGKSTLLQLICGTLEPSSGSVEVRGRIAALLELGTGFNPEFSGRENLVINAAILGLSTREIEQRLDDILAFADIGDFIDQPVKTYSSGMYVRLAFSVAVHVDPQILIVDEALAVGDALFQAKCMTRMRRMLDDGVSLLFTSHDIGAVKALCQRALWLEQGQVYMLGAGPDVTRAYDQDWVRRSNDAQAAGGASRPAQPGAGPGSGAAKLMAVHWGCSGLLGSRASASYGDTLQLRIRVKVVQACTRLVVSYHIKNRQNQHLVGGHTADRADVYQRHWLAGELFDVVFQLPVQWHAGDYALSVLVASIGDTERYTDAVFHTWVDDVASLNVLPRTPFPLSDWVEPPVGFRLVSQAPWVILDDFFPNLLTGFRVAEFNAHLAEFPQLSVMSSLGTFASEFEQYRLRYPQYADRVSAYHESALAGVAFAYISFLNNASHFLPDLTAHQVPFALTLYPGGGLGFDDPQSDAKLAAVLASPLLRAVIVTQAAIEAYLVQFARRNHLRLPLLQRVDGVVVSPDYFDADSVRHGPRFGLAKAVMDVCFVAECYMPLGRNKGYPEFIAAAIALADRPELRFHVVGGGFAATDLDVSALGSRLHYHGRLETSVLRKFFSNMDLIVSPNRPGLLHGGNFDGFPTCACVEAALCEVAVMATDALQQNPGYQDQVSLFFLTLDGVALETQIVANIRHLLAHPQQLCAVAQAGQQVSRNLYAPQSQIAPRQRLFRELALP